MKDGWEKVKFKILKKRNSKKYYTIQLLKLNSNKAQKLLKWKCLLTFKETISMIVWWYEIFTQKNIANYLTLFQINLYENYKKI